MDEMDKVICLACGGVVGNSAPLKSGEFRCRCSTEKDGERARTRVHTDDESQSGPPDVAPIICPSCGEFVEHGSTRCSSCGQLIASRRCPWCLAWNLDDARVCVGCGRRLDEPAPKTLLCPRCNVPLSARQSLDLAYHACSSCGGMFLRPSMIQRIVSASHQAQRLRLALPKSEQHTVVDVVEYIRCPACGDVMNRKMFGRFSGVVVDVCSKHGIWFDRSELAEVLEFVQRGGLDKLRERTRQEQRLRRSHDKAREFNEQLSRDTTQAGAAEFSTPFGPANRTPAGIEFLRTIIDLWRSR